MQVIKLTPDLRVLSAKDIESLTGLKDRQVRRLMSQVREYYQKRKRAKIVISEFCHVHGYKLEAVCNFFGVR